LGDLHPEHAFYPHRRSAPALALGVERLDLGYQRRPRRDRFDLTEKPKRAL